MGSGETGLKSAILFYSVIDILAGTLTWFLLKGGSAQPTAKPKNGLSNLLEAIKVPGIWLVSLNVFMVYIVYCGLTYFIPYLKEMYGLPVALVGAYGIINQYFLKILGGPAGGFIADKQFKSTSRYLKWAFLALLPLMGVIMLIPKKPELYLCGHGGHAVVRADCVFPCAACSGAPWVKSASLRTSPVQPSVSAA